MASPLGKTTSVSILVATAFFMENLDGTVIATGTHRDLLLNDPRYAEVLARVSEEHVDDDVMFNDEGVDL